MGRKDLLIKSLNARLLQEQDEARALRAQASADRHAMEGALDALSTENDDDLATAERLLAERLQEDPRPASAEGSLHWLHVVDGDRLVWRLASELVRLHDAEALRQGRPTWTAPRLEGDPPGHPELGVINLPGPPASPPLLRLDDYVRLPTGIGSDAVLLRVKVIRWHHSEGWSIKLDGPDPLRGPEADHSAGLIAKVQDLCDEYDLADVEKALYSGLVDHGPEPKEQA